MPSLPDHREGARRGAFLEGMSRTAATVNIVTTDGPAGRAGVTVLAMSSVFADAPAPSLLVCIHREGSASRPILANGVFCVNVLREDQSAIADVFAGRIGTESADRFACARWTAIKTGAPRVIDPLVAFDCRLTHSELIGTHYVMIGAVAETFIAATGRPLIYTARDYGTPTRLKRAA